MSAIPARQELHELVDRLAEPQAQLVLRLVKSELGESNDVERPWPKSIGAGHSGLGDLATNPEKYFAQGFGQ